jgi:hypothetical protein
MWSEMVNKQKTSSLLFMSDLELRRLDEVFKEACARAK